MKWQLLKNKKLPSGSTESFYKIADNTYVLDTVIEFSNSESETPIRIHEKLRNMYHNTAADVSIVRR